MSVAAALAHARKMGYLENENEALQAAQKRANNLRASGYGANSPAEFTRVLNSRVNSGNNKGLKTLLNKTPANVKRRLSIKALLTFIAAVGGVYLARRLSSMQGTVPAQDYQQFLLKYANGL